MVRTILVHIFCVRPATNQSNRRNLPQNRGTKVRFRCGRLHCCNSIEQVYCRQTVDTRPWQSRTAWPPAEDIPKRSPKGIPPLNGSDIGVAEVSFRTSLPRLKMASTVARSE